MVDIAINWINPFAVNNTTFGFPGTYQLERTFEQLDPREFSLLQVSLDKYIKSARTTVSNSDENVTCTHAGHVQVISVQLSGLFNPLYFCFSVSASLFVDLVMSALCASRGHSDIYLSNSHCTVLRNAK